MNKPPDLPPSANEPAPTYDRKIDKALQQLGDFDGVPWFRCVWAQSEAATRFWRGEQYFKYRDHVEKAEGWGVPVYDLAGQFAGYEAVYPNHAIIPAGIVIDAVVIEKEIAIPRFFIEIATWMSEDEWKAQRYTDEQGRMVRQGNGLVDFLGEYPKGGFDYEMLWLVAEHRGCCEEVSEANNVGRGADGRRCFGFRRLPNMNDVANIANRVAYFHRVKSQINAGVDEAAAVRATAQNESDVAEYWQKYEKQMAEDNYQVLRPRLKRLTTPGHGLDLFEYNFVPKGYDEIKKASEKPLIMEK